MRWLRFILTLLSARFRSKLTIRDESVVPFHVWLTDVDISIMNHAALMTVMETGRIDFMVRTGFLRQARKQKWYFPSSSISVQFFMPLKLFQKASVSTSVLHVDAKWIYVEQKVTRKGKTIAVCVVKSTIKKGREHINVLDVIKHLNLGKPPVVAQDIIECLEEENKHIRERLC